MNQMDTWIGQNVERLRAASGKKQADVAAEMSEHGFKWSQRTVWAVEKGERPLRLAEAEFLAPILGGGTAQLVTPPEAAQVLNSVFDAAEGTKPAIDALVAGLDAADSASVMAAWTLKDLEEREIDIDAIREVVPGIMVGRYMYALRKVERYAKGGIRAFIADAEDLYATQRGWKTTEGDLDAEAD